MNYTKTIAAFILSSGYILQGGLYTKKKSVEIPIVIVICSYNNDQWSENTLKSVFTQEYNNFRVIIVDDCSTDNNCEVIQKCIEDHQPILRFFHLSIIYIPMKMYGLLMVNIEMFLHLRLFNGDIKNWVIVAPFPNMYNVNKHIVTIVSFICIRARLELGYLN